MKTLSVLMFKLQLSCQMHNMRMFTITRTGILQLLGY